MATDMTGLYIEEYSSSLDAALQQKTSVLSSMVRDMGFFEGDKLYLPKIDNKEAQNFTRNGGVQGTDPDTGFIELTATAKEASHVLYDFDKGKINESTRSAAAAQAASDDISALMRAKDKIIYDAMEAAAIDTTEGVMKTVGSYDTPLDFLMVAEAAAELGSNYAWEDGKMGILMPFKVNLNAGLDVVSLLKTKQTDPIAEAIGGFMDPLKQLKGATYEMVSQHAGTGSNIGCNIYLWNKDAIAAAHNNALEKFNERLNPKTEGLGTVIGAWLRMGAKVRNKKGIICLKCRYNMPLAIRPLPTKEAA